MDESSGALPSPDWDLLNNRISLLKQALLPPKWDPLGFYSSELREQAAAFTLMAHAEIESYIEVRVSSYADAKEEAWIVRQEAHKSLLALIQVAFTDATRQAHLGSPSLDDLVRLGRRMLRSRVSNNHGIKEENLAKLLPAIGIDLVELPVGLAPDMTSLGAKRGAYAHTSGHTRTLVNPQDEFVAVMHVLAALKGLDDLTVAT
jgi:hypothetical protein